MSESINHVGFSVANFEASLSFYTAALAPLGMKPMVNFEYEGDRHAGFGSTRPDFWIGTSPNASGRIHLAFTATTRAQVNEFYTAAVAAGGRDNGGPGPRPQYSANYYAAFVFDPDGNNIEAVCHAAE